MPYPPNSDPPQAGDAFEAKSWMYTYPFGGCMMILLVLYLLDAFWPPHIPGQLFVLYDKDRFLARGILLIAFLLFVFGNFLMAEWYPYVPMLSTIFLIPIGLGLTRMALQPKQRVKRDKAVLTDADIQTKIQVLANITGLETDQLNFYRATCVALLCSFAGSLAVWVVWLLGKDRLKDMENLDGKKNKEIYFLQFSCPLVVAISNLVFALFCSFRVFMQRAYLATDNFRGELIVQTAQQMKRTSLHADLQKHADIVNRSRKSVNERDVDLTDSTEIQLMKDRYLNQTSQSMRHLSMLVKLTGCVFMVLIGMLYVATNLLYADSSVASMIMALMGAFFLIFAVFVYVAFKRLVDSVGKWLGDLPIWRQAAALLRSEWTFAFLLTTQLPWIPFVLLLSAVNQMVRKARGIASRAVLVSSKADADTENTYPPPETLCLTPRVWKHCRRIAKADYLSLIKKSYCFSALYFCYTVVPLLLNVTLSWIIMQLGSWNFAIILVATFVIGVIAFLLPPVPGMTVYIFGGLIVSDTCPLGFGPGAVINIFVCFFLKLAACAVQQKCIGGVLGQSIWVRQTVGVHKVAIRCIEAEMRKPGLTLGKVAILCGGPDWPVSVLAGVLGLSLVQCELGTIPVIFFVAPCALTGSFYLKKGTSEIWTRLANMMIVTSVVVNLFLWALAAWAIQNQLENNYEELTRPLPANVELEWLDHKTAEIGKRSVVTWRDVPRPVRSLYLLGAFIHTMVCQAFFWGYSHLFGDFQVSDPIDSLVWTGKDGLFSRLALMVLAGYGVGFIGYVLFPVWRSAKTAGARRAAAQDLSTQESAWKEQWLKDAEDKLRKAAEGTSEETKAPEEPVSPRSDHIVSGLVIEPPDSPSPVMVEEEPMKVVDEGEPPQPEVQCRSCGNTGKDFMGNICSCPYGKELILEPEQQKAEEKADERVDDLQQLALMSQAPVLEEKMSEEIPDKLLEPGESPGREKAASFEASLVPQSKANWSGLSTPKSEGHSCFCKCCVIERGKKEVV